jgi:hypothetical protein
MESLEKRTLDKRILFGGILVGLTAALDSYYTIHGVNSGLAPELNPIFNQFINTLGTETGLISAKALLITPALFICLKKRNSIPLYIASLGQTIGAAMWAYLSYSQ